MIYSMEGTMDIRIFREAQVILNEIIEYEYTISQWNERNKKDIGYLSLTSDDIFIEFKQKVIADLEYQKRQLEIEFENL